MPKIFLAHRSDAHRKACLALYRALLKECNIFGSQVASRSLSSPLTNLIRYRFRHDRRAVSAYAIKDALTRGHEHLALLHDANTGSQAARDTLKSTMMNTLKHADDVAIARVAREANRKPFTKRQLRGIEHIEREATKENHRPPSDSVPLSALPVPLSEIRTLRDGTPRRPVPYLSSAQGRTAFIRWPHQGSFPVWISRVMRQKQKRLDRMYDYRQELAYTLALSQYEDRWDSLVEKENLAQDSVIRREPVANTTWTFAPQGMINQLSRIIWRVESERGERGRWLWDIVKKERKLSDWELLPERLVKNDRKINQLLYKTIGEAHRLGRIDLADKWAQKLVRRRKYQEKEHKDLMNMYWVIPVEWVKKGERDTAPEPGAVSEADDWEAQASDSAANSETFTPTQPPKTFQPGWRTQLRQRAHAFQGDDEVEVDEDSVWYPEGHDFEEALETSPGILPLPPTPPSRKPLRPVPVSASERNSYYAALRKQARAIDLPTTMRQTRAEAGARAATRTRTRLGFPRQVQRADQTRSPPNPSVDTRKALDEVKLLNPAGRGRTRSRRTGR